MFKHLRKHIGAAQVRLKDVDKAYCLRVIKAFENAEARHGGKLAASTVCTYLEIFTACLNLAVRNGIIPLNPMYKIDASDYPQPGKGSREYLSFEEIKMLFAEPCQNDNVKRAFLFACFCGLRYSDIEALTWQNIFIENGQTFAKIIVKKTRQPLKLPLSDEAVKWLPAKDGDRVFKLPHVTTVAEMVKAWAKKAGIQKKVTFHVSRHTFATMMLTVGADLYTISKLLGHSNITTTQIYAKIVDAKKAEAVNLVNGMFNND